MSFNIPSLDTLVYELTRLPGIGEKTAQRLAFFILKEGGGYSGRLQTALQEMSQHVHACPECFCYTDQEQCRICASSERDQTVICVVEKPSDVIRLESAAIFRGRYHVLQGTIAPLEGIGPSDIRIQELLERLERHPEIREVILALDSDLEGDTTALYLSKLLQPKNIRLSRIAHGVPFGSDIDYVDYRTLGHALQNRVEL